MAGGRPHKYQSIEELETLIENYFKDCESKTYIDNNGVRHIEPLTITGLALALDTTRQGLLNYEGKAEFYDTIKRAKTIVENFAERKLFGNNATGAIFALKNYGWRDKTESEQTVRTQVISAEPLTEAEWAKTHGKLD